MTTTTTTSSSFNSLYNDPYQQQQQLNVFNQLYDDYYSSQAQPGLVARYPAQTYGVRYNTTPSQYDPALMIGYGLGKGGGGGGNSGISIDGYTGPLGSTGARGFSFGKGFAARGVGRYPATRGVKY